MDNNEMTLREVIAELEQAFDVALENDPWIFEMKAKLECLGYRPHFVSKSGIVLEKIAEDAPTLKPVLALLAAPKPTETELEELKKNHIKW